MIGIEIFLEKYAPIVSLFCYEWVELSRVSKRCREIVRGWKYIDSELYSRKFSIEATRPIKALYKYIDRELYFRNRPIYKSHTPSLALN